MDYDVILTAATEYADKYTESMDTGYESIEKAGAARNGFIDGALFAQKTAQEKRDAIMSVLFSALREMRMQRNNGGFEILGTAIDQINRL